MITFGLHQRFGGADLSTTATPPLKMTQRGADLSTSLKMTEGGADLCAVLKMTEGGADLSTMLRVTGRGGRSLPSASSWRLGGAQDDTAAVPSCGAR